MITIPDAAGVVAATVALKWVPFAQSPVLASLLALAAFVAAGVAACLVANYFASRRAAAQIEDLPGPKGSGVFGASIIAIKNSRRRYDWIAEMYQEHCPGGKKTWKLTPPPFLPMLGGSGHEIHTISPKNVEHILRGNWHNYLKSTARGGPFIAIIPEWLGEGIFTIDHGPNARMPPDGGKSWYNQRSTGARIFTQGNFRTFYRDVFVRHGNQLSEALEAKQGQTVDVQQLMFAYTMDSFGKIAFGVDMGNLSGKDAGFGVAFDGAHNAMFSWLFNNFKKLVIREALPEPFAWIWERVTCRLSCPIYRTFRRHIKELDRYSYDVIRRRRADPNLGKSTDLLGCFMAATDEATGKPYSDRALRDIVLSFIIAGRDTTACTLSWLWYELALPQNAAVQERLIEEVDRTLQGDEPTFELVEKEMPYLRGVIYEVLRLHPIVPHTAMNAVRDDVLPDGTKVPAGSRVFYDTYVMGRDKDRWGEDADQLRPERWIPFKAPSQYEFPVFKGGPRLCLGMNMAIFEASLAAAMVLQRFTLALVPGHEYTYSRMATMSVQDKASGKQQLLMTVQPRAAEC